MGSPGIILKSKFTLPKVRSTKTGKQVRFSDYSKYIVREEALLNKDDLSLKETTELERIQSKMKELDEVLGIKKEEKETTDRDEEKLREQRIVKVSEAFLKFADSEEYADYIGYMTRENALEDKKETYGLDESEEQELEKLKIKNAEKIEEYGEKNIQTYRKMDEVYPGVFSHNKNEITRNDLMEFQEMMDSSQKKNGVLWQDVISFDNDFLIEEGIVDRRTGRLNEERIREASHKMMNSQIKNEEYLDAKWMATIHRNTEHTHIHYALIEGQPSREVDYFHYYNHKLKRRVRSKEKQPRGKRKADTIQEMKLEFGRSLVDHSLSLTEISRLRNGLYQEVKDTLSFSDKDLTIIKSLKEIDSLLPSGWEKLVKAKPYPKYGYRSIKDPYLKGRINDTVQLFLNGSNQYEEYKTLVSSQQEDYKRLYGESDDGTKDYEKNQLTDLDGRLGNALLNQMASIKDDKTAYYNHFEGHSNLDKFIWVTNKKSNRKILRSFQFEIDKEKTRAMREHEFTQQQVDRQRNFK